MIRQADPMPDDGPAIEPLALSARDAAAALSISERTLKELTYAGEMPHVRLGRRVLYPVHLLREWLTGQAEGTAEKPPPAQSKSGRR
ncbi:MAG: helix-turn-helix domain-containing protein [Planctomycetota bacterium]